ncbi:MAG: MBL fold metallo-hydrolase [Deltaproteobacteria bacterium]|nr:MBL fold metallo-hydrolase [Deltaproteobacteria bacterium]
MRWALRIAAALPLLALAALALRIVPAHLQIRRVAPRLPSAEELRSLTSAPGGPRSLRWINTSSQPLARGVIAHSVFLAEWPDGSLFEVDAGMDAAAAVEFGELLGTLSGGGQVTPHGTVSEQIGSAVARVRGLGFTHLHIDHTQGIEALCAAGPAPGARVYQGESAGDAARPEHRGRRCASRKLVLRSDERGRRGPAHARRVPGHGADSARRAHGVLDDVRVRRGQPRLDPVRRHHQHARGAARQSRQGLPLQRPARAGRHAPHRAAAALPRRARRRGRLHGGGLARSGGAAREWPAGVGGLGATPRTRLRLRA